MHLKLDPRTFDHRSLYLVFLPLDGALQLVQLVLQLSDYVRFSLYLVQLCLPFALQQGTLHLRLEQRITQSHTMSQVSYESNIILS